MIELFLMKFVLIVKVCVSLFGDGCCVNCRLILNCDLLFRSCLKCVVLCGVVIMRMLWIFVSMSVDSG